MKKISVYFILISLLGIVLLSLYINFYVEGRRDNFFSKVKVFVFDTNSLSVESDKNFDINKIMIKDFQNNILFENGIVKNKIQNEYGDMIFDFYYENKQFARVGHFKTNWWHSHDYYFSLIKKSDSIVIETDFEGANAETGFFINYY